MLIAAALALYILAMLAAGASDLTRYEIPNRLSLAVLAGFLLLLPSLPFSVFVTHMSAGLAVLVTAAVLFFAGLWGGGDVKLIAAASVWIGWSELAAFLLLTALIGMVLALVLLAARRYLADRDSHGRWYCRLLSRGEGIPYGVAIAAAALVLTPRLGVLDIASLG